MEKYDVYKDIATRSGGDLYIGVVGPVRTGKSTFITRFMENIVIPNISNKNTRERVKDSLPQSGDGTMVMTTEPKFIPSTGVALALDKKIQMKVRLIDCVGYLVDGAVSSLDSGKPRMVSTPWSKSKMTFEEASEIGTSKVISEHSTVGVVVTCDGSISEIERSAYVSAEERAISELKEIGKPFVVVMNCKNPDDEFSQALQKSLNEKYGVSVLAMNLSKMTKDDCSKVVESLLLDFPLNKIKIDLPSWMGALPYEDKMIFDIMKSVKTNMSSIERMNSYERAEDLLKDTEYLNMQSSKADASNGSIVCVGEAREGLFYEVISSQCNMEIKSESELIYALKELSEAKLGYDKIKTALDEVKEKGYGIVPPALYEMQLEEPELTEHSGQYGVRLKASAPSMHIMRVDVDTEINPIVGTEQQGEKLAQSLLDGFKSNPNEIWETNIFGKSLNILVNDGLNNKISNMPEEVKNKMRKTVSRIVNEGKGGVICILL